MVEVDCHTGDSSVLLADLVVDVGKSVNPGIDVGQIEGGFIQGQGYATDEQILLSPTTGEVLTNGPGSYKVRSLIIFLQLVEEPNNFFTLLRSRLLLTSRESSTSLC